jgi:hypothetical protein
MTVKELIDQLQSLPQNMEVCIPEEYESDRYEACEVELLETKKVVKTTLHYNHCNATLWLFPEDWMVVEDEREVVVIW